MLPFSKFKISGHSMEPLIKNGNTVFATNILYLFTYPKVNDIIIFEKNKKYFVKRISKIENNKYFVTGDNKKDSLDSRKFGNILRNQILGKVIYKF